MHQEFDRKGLKDGPLPSTNEPHAHGTPPHLQNIFIQVLTDLLCLNAQFRADIVPKKLDPTFEIPSTSSVTSPNSPISLGVTEFVNLIQLPDGKCIQDHLVKITDGGLDFTFDVTRNVWPTFIRHFFNIDTR